MKMVKLYSYSSDPPAIEEVKWIWAKLAAAVILVSVIIFFGIVELRLFVGHDERSRSEKSLELENRILRQELGSISPRVRNLEAQTNQLSKHVGVLHALLAGPATTADSLSHMRALMKETSLQSIIPVATTLSR